MIDTLSDTPFNHLKPTRQELTLANTHTHTLILICNRANIFQNIYMYIDKLHNTNIVIEYIHFRCT